MPQKRHTLMNERERRGAGVVLAAHATLDKDSQADDRGEAPVLVEPKMSVRAEDDTGYVRLPLSDLVRPGSERRFRAFFSSSHARNRTHAAPLAPSMGKKRRVGPAPFPPARTTQDGNDALAPPHCAHSRGWLKGGGRGE